MSKVLKVERLQKSYWVKRSFKKPVEVKALKNISFELGPSQTLAIVGESGCGKSTLARNLILLETPDSGKIVTTDGALDKMSAKDRVKFIQLIFQDPYSCLNPRQVAWKIVAEPLIIHHKVSRESAYQQAVEMMQKVGLGAEYAMKYPHMLSGGQRQRLGLARGLILRPKILVLDEPISALDVSIQAQVLNLLVELQKEFQLAYIFIGHDLTVVRHIADQIIVMYLGEAVEQGDSETIFNHPTHPYTQALLKSTPILGSTNQFSGTVSLQGELPSPLNPPPGCSFHKRCPYATERCQLEPPKLRFFQNRLSSCHHLESIYEKNNTASPSHL